MWILFIHNMCVIKAGRHWCVRNDIETHRSTGVTGLHSQWSRLCNPVTQSLVFHCHFAHTMRSCYIDSRYLVVKYNRNQDIGLNLFGPLTPTSIVIQLRTSTVLLMHCIEIVRFVMTGTISTEKRPLQWQYRVNSGWSPVWLSSNIGLSTTQCEEIPFFWLTLFLVSMDLVSVWLNCISSVEITLVLLADIITEWGSVSVFWFS